MLHAAVPWPKAVRAENWEIAEQALPQAGLLESSPLCSVEKYRKQVNDDSLDADTRHLAALLVAAEKSLECQQLEEARRCASEALASSRKTGDAMCITSAVRLLVCAENVQGRLKEAHEVANGQLEAFRASGDRAGEARMLLLLAGINSDKRGSRNRQRAKAWAAEARRYFADTGESKLEAQALLALVNIMMKQRGDRLAAAEEVKQLVNAAVPLLRAAGDLRGEAVALHGLACAKALLAAYEGAHVAGMEAAQLFREAKLPRLEAFELHCVAVWKLLDEDAEGAAVSADDALELYAQEQGPCRRDEAAVLQTLVRAYCASKEFKRALEAASDSLERFQEFGDSRAEATALEMMAFALSQSGDVPEAIKRTRQQMALFHSLEDKKAQSRSLRTLCRLCLHCGDTEQGQIAAKEASALSEELRLHREQAVALQLLADCQSQQQCYLDAKDTVAQARRLFARAEDHVNEASAALQAAQLAALAGDHAGAVLMCVEAQELAKRAFCKHLECSAYHMLTGLHLESGQLNDALRMMKKALTCSRQEGNKKEESKCLLLAVMVNLAISNKETAAANANEGDQSTAERRKRAATRMDKAEELAKEGLLVARRAGNSSCLAKGLHAAAMVQLQRGNYETALQKAEAAKRKYESGEEIDGALDVHFLIVTIHFEARSFEQAITAAEAVIRLAQDVGSRMAEECAWTCLQEIKQAQEEAQRTAGPHAEVTKLPSASPTSLPSTAQSSQSSMEPPEPSNRRLREELPELPKLELNQALDTDLVRGLVVQCVQVLVGCEEDIEPEKPLLDVGLTSQLAVVLRDQLTTMLPGLNPPLPVTLIFDYPSTAAISRLVQQTAQEACRRSAAG